MQNAKGFSSHAATVATIIGNCVSSPESLTAQFALNGILQGTIACVRVPSQDQYVDLRLVLVLVVVALRQEC